MVVVKSVRDVKAEYVSMSVTKHRELSHPDADGRSVAVISRSGDPHAIDVDTDIIERWRNGVDERPSGSPAGSRVVSSSGK